MSPLFTQVRNGIIFSVTCLTCFGIAYAAISWPTTPSGETAGGKYASRLVPTGFVGAFNLVTCPTGWSEYAPAYGRVIRGIDKSGTNIDPAGLRTVGNLQADAFQGHGHNLYAYNLQGMGGGGVSLNIGANYPANTWGSATAVREYTTDGSNGTPQTANETRMKNIALLYCIKD